MSELVFYTNPQSRGRIAHWMMEELAEPYETVWLDYGTTMKAPDYLAVNPMGKVPALRHGDAVVTEAAAICAYLGDRFPEKGLIPPPGSPARADYYRWLFFAAGPLEQAIIARSLGWEVPEGKHGQAGFGSLELTIDALDGWLSENDFIAGARFTMADTYVGSQFVWGLRFGSIPERPSFKAYVERITQRPAYAEANAIDAAIAAGIADPGAMVAGGFRLEAETAEAAGAEHMPGHGLIGPWAGARR